MIEIKPKGETLTRVKLCTTTLYKSRDSTYYYALELNPYNFKQTGNISILHDNQTAQVNTII